MYNVGMSENLYP